LKILIKNGTIVDPANNIEELADLLIQDGIIKEIGKNLSYVDAKVVDCKGMYVVPGLIDMHCHLREPGFEYKETIETGILSAAAGGFTSIACMPNTKPVVDNPAIIKYIKEKADSLNKVNVFPIACITKGQEGQELAEIGELKFAGAIAISDDGKPVSNSLIMRRALQYSKMFDMLVISHCEDFDLVDEGVMNEGYVSTILGLKGIPREAEEVMVARDIILAEHNDCAIHIAHVSTRGSVEQIRNAKKRNVRVTAETCPHYFSITDEAAMDYNTNAKVNPPLRTNDDVQAIIEGLKDGTIDVIATDHAPHHIDEKNVEFNLASFGMVGFETALPLSITNLVTAGHITYKQLIEKMSYNPSKILGINKGTLTAGSDADITIFNPIEEIIIDVKEFKTKSRNTPFDGYKLKGRVYYTIAGGKII
jgi:dihydroorotase